MTSPAKIAVIAIASTIGFGSGAVADEKMDQIIQHAMPYMHHSCESIIANYGDDEVQVLEMVRLMAMVSLFNREKNVEVAVPDEAEREDLDVEFLEVVRVECEGDPDALLAGVVDAAVKASLE